MAGTRTPSRPSFFWQGLLIVLPVVVLVAVGVYSLHQDKRLAQREAEDRARAIADDLVPLIWNELTTHEANDLQQPFFTVDANGQLIFPPARDAVPTPKPFDLAVLNPEQARLWQALQSAAADSQNDEALIRASESFIKSNPPDNFAAAANYGLGLALVQQKKLPEAAARFDLVAVEYPVATGESGLPLRELAMLKLFEIQPRGETSWNIIRDSKNSVVNQNAVNPGFPPATVNHSVSLESLCSNIVTRPTPLTPYLLQELDERWMPAKIPQGKVRVGQEPNHVGTAEMQEAIRKWQCAWNEHELSRELFASARVHFPTNHLLSVTSTVPRIVEMPRLFWFDTATGLKTSFLEVEEQHWLALRSENGTNGSGYVCLAESKIGIRVSGLLDQVKSLPNYFGVGIELAGRKVNEFAPNLRKWQYHHYGGKGGHVDREDRDEIATNIVASATKLEAGENLLKVNVYLTNPAALFQSQRSRAVSFGLLIALATVAAVIGLLAAWQAFNRQLRLSEMKSNFVSSVSHELRAPIASVRLLAESLERGKVSEPAKQNEYFRFIGQECRRLSSLIENVLDFSRIEQGCKQYEFEPTDVSALVEQTVKLMQSYATEKGVRLEWDIPSPGLTATFSPSDGERDGVRGRVELNVDGRAIQQALVNLIDNAIKHSPRDAVVTVAAEVSGATDQVSGGESANNLIPRTSYLALSVTDHGPGIPVSEHERIFERFYRLGSELRRETPGVGIGLSIVKHIVEAHGGHVRVESEPGKGSRFAIELPLTQQEQTEITEGKKK